MNQAFLLNTDSVIPANKASASSQDLKSGSASKANEPQAFSSELKKHLNENNASKLESEHLSRNGKDSQKGQNSLDGDKRQTEEVGSENGNALPKESLTTDVDVSEEVQQELFIADIDEALSQEVNEDDDTEIVESVDEETPEAETKQTILEQLHAVGRNITTNEDDAVVDTGKKLGKMVSSLVQNMPKHQNNGNVENKDVASDDKIVANKSLQSAEQSKAITNIRPDILQALSQRTAGTTEDKNNNSVESIAPKIVITTEKVDANEKLMKGQLEITEIAKQIKSEISVAGKSTLDKGSSSFASTLVSSIHNHVANTPTANTAMRTESPLLDIQPEVQSKAWGKVLSSRVVWMAQEGIQQAALRLNPASLGSIEVKLSLQNEQVNISFIAQHAATRDALEQALPRLRESFGENGLELADAEVSQQETFEQDDDATDSEHLDADGDNVVASEGSNEQESTLIKHDDGSLSLYA